MTLARRLSWKYVTEVFGDCLLTKPNNVTNEPAKFVSKRIAPPKGYHLQHCHQHSQCKILEIVTNFDGFTIRGQAINPLTGAV